MYKIYGYFHRDRFSLYDPMRVGTRLGDLLLRMGGGITSMVVQLPTENSWAAITMGELSILHVGAGELIIFGDSIRSFSEPEGAVAYIAIESRPSIKCSQIQQAILRAREAPKEKDFREFNDAWFHLTKE